MRARTRFIAPLAMAVALTAACGSSGSSGTGGTAASGSSGGSGASCAPVADTKLVVLEDDKHLQNADNVVPAVNSDAAQSNAALVPALNAVSAKLTTKDLVAMNNAVDVQRKSADDVAAAWVKDHDVTSGLTKGSGKITVGAAGFTESKILATIYSDVLKAAGVDASVRDVGSRELYLPALTTGTDIQAFPEYAATVTEFINKKVNGPDATPIATGDVKATLSAVKPLADQLHLTFGDASQAADQNAFAVTKKLADTLKVTKLSQLAAACSGSSLILGGPTECPTRPFCQPGLEKTYGLKFGSFQALDAGGPLTKAAIQQGKVSIGLVFSSDGSLAP
jgi:osmoprotectant transport system substrate-binding protein